MGAVPRALNPLDTEVVSSAGEPEEQATATTSPSNASDANSTLLHRDPFTQRDAARTSPADLEHHLLAMSRTLELRDIRVTRQHGRTLRNVCG
jgi:hypothetical protein